MKNKKKQKMKLNKIPILLLALIVTLGMAAGCGKKPEEATFSSAAVQEKAPKSVSVTLTKDQVKILTDAKLLSGVQDYIVETGTDVDFAKLISYDKNVFEGVEVDDKKVDYKKTGDYKVAYLLTIDNAALKKAMKGKEKTVSFPEAKDAETILAGYESKVSVMTKEEAAKAAEASGGEKPAVINTNTYNETVQHNQENVSNHAQAQSAPVAANASNGGNAGNGNNGNAGNNTPAGGNNGGNAGGSNNSGNNGGNAGGGNNGGNSQPVQPTQPTQPTQPPTQPPTEAPTQPVHVHNWVAATHTEYKEYYNDIVEYHQACNGCGIPVYNMEPNERTNHLANCGGSSSSQPFVVGRECYAREPYEVVDYYYCSECGARQ